MATNATTASHCPSPMKATSNGLFQGDNPLDYALPLAILQICLVVALTRILAFLLRPLRQPRVIAEIVVSSSLRMHTLNFLNSQCCNFLIPYIVSFGQRRLSSGENDYSIFFSHFLCREEYCLAHQLWVETKSI